MLRLEEAEGLATGMRDLRPLASLGRFDLDEPTDEAGESGLAARSEGVPCPVGV